MRLTDVVVIEPLIVPDDRTVTVRVVVEPAANGDRRIRIDSDSGLGATWTTHSEASLVREVDPPAQLDLPVIDARCQLGGADPMASASRASAHLRSLADAGRRTVG